MSRSKRKVIYKDKGNVNNYYWKVHRRVNKAICKDFFEHSKYPTERDDNWDEYHNLRRLFLKEGYCEEEAQMKAEDLIDWDSYWIQNLTSNCHVEFCVEPEFKRPQELVNDYDYSDYRLDYEWDKVRGYFRDYSQDLKSESWRNRRQVWAKKLRRK